MGGPAHSGSSGVSIEDPQTGATANVIGTDGYYGAVTVTPGHVSTDNSTTTPLNAGISFTGEWENISNYGVIVISATSDVASATDGLMVQFSSDGTIPGILTDDEFTLSAGAKKTWSFQAAAKYFRLVYTNGASNQTSFNLQTILKPYYVKPSSHRIQDIIADEDDAELVKSVISSQSELTGYFENVSSYRSALNVNSAWVHRKIVNETLHQHDGTTNLNSAASEGDISISVDDTTGFLVGNQIKLEETVAGIGIQEIGIMTITAVAAGTPGTLTLDRPIGNDYTTAAVISNVISNMAVAGTLASPQIFEVDPPPGTIWQLTRVMFSITDQAPMDDSLFGGITALTNGVCLRATTAAGRMVVFANWKSNADMKLDMYDASYSDKAPAGFYGFSGRWTFTRAEVVAELDGDATPLQKFQVLIQDDLTTMDTFYMRAQGRVFLP